MKGATAEELAKEIHRHIVKHVKRQGVYKTATVVSVDGTVPPSLTIMFAGSSTPVSGIIYGESYEPVGNDTVVLLRGDHGDWYVSDGFASA